MCAMIALVVAIEAYIVMLPFVRMERAGQAIGGECLVMVLAGLVTYCALSRLLAKRREEDKCEAQKN